MSLVFSQEVTAINNKQFRHISAIPVRTSYSLLSNYEDLDPWLLRFSADIPVGFSRQRYMEEVTSTGTGATSEK